MKKSESLRAPLLNSGGAWKASFPLFAGCLAMMIHRWGFAMDDPWITFRYAQNLAEGRGLVFNPGERLEGYSNFLLVLGCAVLEKLRLDAFDWTRLGGAICLLGAVALLGAGERKMAREESELPQRGRLIFRRNSDTSDAPDARGSLSLLSLAGMAYLALSPQAAVWAVSGMETPYYLLSLTCVWFFAAEAWTARSRSGAWGWGLGAAACALAAAGLRSDGFLAAGMLAVFAGWEMAHRRPPAFAKPLLASAALFAAAFFAYHFWRASYFGDWVPNPARAKAMGPLADRLSAGWGYVWKWLGRAGGLGLLLALWSGFRALGEWRGWSEAQASAQAKEESSREAEGAAFWRERDQWPGNREASARTPAIKNPGLGDDVDSGAFPPAPQILSRGEALLRLAFCGLSLQALWAIWVGGDWMPAARFMVPAIGFVGILAGAGLRRMKRGGCAGAFLIWVIILWIGLGVWRGDKRDAELQWCIREGRVGRLWQPLREIGQWMGAAAPPEAVLAATEAGLVPYYSRLKFIDMFGIVDRHIASMPGGLHAKFDARYVLSRRPDYILLCATKEKDAQGFPARGAFAPDEEMLRAPEFRAQYAARREWPRDFPAPRALAMVLFERK